VSFFLLAFPALFSIVNPLGGAFIFLGATEHVSVKVRNELAKWIAIYSFAIVTASMYVGAYVLTFFGISISVLRAAGGIVIAAAAWRMLNAPDDEAPKTAADVAAELPATHTMSRMAFYPLTMPITTGPGTISVAVSLGTNRPRDRRAFVVRRPKHARDRADLRARVRALPLRRAVVAPDRPYRNGDRHAPVGVPVVLHRRAGLLERRGRAAHERALMRGDGLSPAAQSAARSLDQ
jgi:MarC family membrane protein